MNLSGRLKKNPQGGNNVLHFLIPDDTENKLNMPSANRNIPKSTAQWVIRHLETGLDRLELEMKEIPSLGPYDVLVRMKAASLNFRDLAILMGSYPFRKLLRSRDLLRYMTVVEKIGLIAFNE